MTPKLHNSKQNIKIQNLTNPKMFSPNFFFQNTTEKLHKNSQKIKIIDILWIFSKMPIFLLKLYVSNTAKQWSRKSRNSL